MQPELIVTQSLTTAGKLLGIRRHAESELLLRQTLKVAGEHGLHELGLKARNLLGLVMVGKGDYESAKAEFAACREADPENYEYLNNLAMCVGEWGDYPKAEAMYREAIALNPDNQSAKNNLALMLRSIGRLDEAVAIQRELWEATPDYRYGLNLSSTLVEAKKMDEAHAVLEVICRDQPEEAVVRVAMGHMLFLAKRFEEGWPHYEYRFGYYPQAKAYCSRFPRDRAWDGRADLAGKTVVAFCEQGIGDMIQFARYCPLLHERGARVVLHCHPALHSLYKSLPWVADTCHMNEGPIPEYDYNVSVLSLPLLLGFPRVEAEYLRRPVAAMKEYEGKLPVGVVWAGNPGHPNDRIRSCPLAALKPIHDLPHVKLFSFQKELAPRAYKGVPGVFDLSAGAEGMKLVHLGDMLETFEDTARLMAAMQYVVTVDTAVAHLAGSMGIPTCLLVAHNPDWRWGMDGVRTEWYPSMRLFRQEVLGEWGPVADEVADWLRG